MKKKNNKKGLITVCDGCPCNAGNDCGPICNLGYDNYEGKFKKLGGVKYTRNVIGKDYYNYWHIWSNECKLVEIRYYDEKGMLNLFKPERKSIK